MSLPLFATDGRVVIVGGGLAGLMVALRLAPEPCLVMAKAPFGTEASSAWAQGGVAAAVGPDDDPEQHMADTIAAGDGLCDPAVVRRILAAAPAAIDDLARLGTKFDRFPDGRLRLGREAAHSRNRIVHAEGDGTGREILRAVLQAVRAHPSIRLLEGVEACRLIVDEGRIAGVLAQGPDGPLLLPTRRVVLATGGSAGLFLGGTSPLGAWGHGLAMAARAGAGLRDLEFVQFHPTALDCHRDPLPLVSEAARGAGAVLVDETGARFMADVPGAELAPRDIVARCVWRQRAAGHRTFLDGRAAIGADFARRFPNVAAHCATFGIDPAIDPIPVRTAAHYHMGGIAVDASGRASVPGLWACGEVASTGLHGANRLASNSLLEAVVCASVVAEDVGGTPAGRTTPPSSAPVRPRRDPSAVRPILSRACGVLRDGRGLASALNDLLPIAASEGPASDAATVGLMMTAAALERRESRGGHYRTDRPHPDPAQARSRILHLGDAIGFAQRYASEEVCQP